MTAMSPDTQIENVAEGDTQNVALKPPKEQAFYTNMMVLMQVLGIDAKLWGMEPKSKKVAFLYKLLNPTCTAAPICFLLQVAYIIINFHDLEFETLGVVYSIAILNLTLVIKLYSSRKESFLKLMRNLMDNIHVYNSYKKDPDNKFLKMKTMKVERMARFTLCFISIFLHIDWSLWTILPCIHYSKNKELILEQKVRLRTCMYLYTPFDYAYNINNWKIIHFSGAYLCMVGNIGTMLFETITYTFFFNLITHVEIFKHNIKVAFEQNLTDKEVSEELAKMVKYHTFILDFFSDIQDGVGLMISANYVQNLFVDSLFLYQLIFGGNDAIMYALMFVVYLGGLIFMSFTLEELRRQSDDLADVIYSLPWESMSHKNQMVLLVILAKVQPPLTFVSAGGLKTGVQPMIGILKSTFSYYVMLKSTV